MRLSDRAYQALERLYFAQRTIRREESERRLAEEDAAQRAYYNALRQRHAAGTCGGAEAGCCYVPCIPRVS
jgi:hypothetical protein